MEQITSAIYTVHYIIYIMGFFNWLSNLTNNILVFLGVIDEQEQDIDILLNKFLIRYETPDYDDDDDLIIIR